MVKGVKVNDQYLSDHVALYNGDTCEIIKGIPDESIDYSVFSPPFSSLFCFTALPQDMGNCDNDDQFFEHFRYVIRDLYRVVKPGRLLTFHCSNLTSTKNTHGVIGIRDFRGDLIRAFCNEGWIYHSEICIWKDPVMAMQRTKALGLLHKQLKKDSCMSRQGIADYVVTMRKPGENREPVWHFGTEKDLILSKLTNTEREEYGDHPPEDVVERILQSLTPDELQRVFTVDRWQKYASPVWMDIAQGRVLDYADGREDDDTKHICPLQLDVIDRCLELWSNPGDTVFTPFLGIGSEAYCSVKAGRKAIGIELKESYYKLAVKNVARAEREIGQKNLFSEVD